MGFPFEDVREFLDDADAHGELQTVKGANPELEVGAITEMIASRPNPPVLLFDELIGHRRGFRLSSNLFNTQRRTAAVLGLDENKAGVELVKAWKEMIGRIKPILSVETSDGPILENVLKGDQIDVNIFPAPRWRELDGGRFIGTGCSVVTKHPETGWINVGTYRSMVLARDKVTLLMAPGKHGDIIRKQYWEKSRNCPVVISLGHEPTFFVVGGYMLTKWGESPFDFAGGLRGRAVKYIIGAETGLPIPATSEAALEGEIVPDSVESAIDGPFAEWPGYFTPAKKTAVVKVKRIYYRNDPIVQGSPPLRPPLPEALGINVISSAALWSELEQHIPEVKGVWCANEGGTGGVPGFFVVVSIKQRYPGHAKQAGLAAASCRAGAYAGRYVVVVEEDIDPANLSDVIWAISTRCDPETGIDIVRGCWDSPVDPLLDPERRKVGDFTNTRAVMNACRPYHNLDSFPPVAITSAESAKRIKEKFPELFRGRGEPLGGFT